jgi:sulfite reductase beta subunit-like hemoprotein
MWSLPEEAIWQELKKGENGRSASRTTAIIKEGQVKLPPKKEIKLFEFALGVLLSLQEKDDRYRTRLKYFLEELYGKEEFEKFVQETADVKETLVFEAERAYPDGLSDESFEVLTKQVEKAFLKKQQEELTRDIRKAEATGDSAKAEKLLSRYSALMKKK